MPTDSRPRHSFTWRAILRGIHDDPQVNSPEEGLEFNRKKAGKICFVSRLNRMMWKQKLLVKGLGRMLFPALFVCIAANSITA
jgi:hypothetical protein